MKRRVFLKVIGGAAGGCAIGIPAVTDNLSAEASAEKIADLPRRVLGRTGHKISVVGFPGLALMHCDQEASTRALQKAFEQGLNYFDVAPEYDRRRCETKMGLGLQGIERSRYFLACKTAQRDRAGAEKELEESLRLLQTDYFDLYQFHHVRRPDEVKQLLGPGGAMEAFLKARDQGKVKYFGFSAHTTKGALAMLQGFKFDTIMFPVNFIEWMKIGFGKPVLELAREQGVAVLGIKTLSLGAWPPGMQRQRQWWYRATETPEETSLALRFTLSQPGVVAGIPPSYVDLLEKAIVAARSYRPMEAESLAKLERVAAESLSLFKSEEDRVALNPETDTPLYADSPYECCSHRWA